MKDPHPPKPDTRRLASKPHRAVPKAKPASASSGSSSESRMHARVGPSAPGGLPLRWKIVVSMASVVITTAVLIFIVVYNKAVTHLNDEINAKGLRLVGLLASIDEAYWLTAIHTEGKSREGELIDLIDELGGKKDWRTLLRAPERKDLQRIYDLAADPFGPAREEEIRRLLSEMVESPNWTETLKENVFLRRKYDRLVRPLPALADLQPLRSLEGEKTGDILRVGVVDVTQSEEGAPAILADGRMQITLLKPVGNEAITIRDAPVNSVDARNFIRNPAPDAKVRLRHYVALSLAGIESAKSQLRTSIFLPILLTGVAGILVAFWVSSLISNPVRVLMKDIEAVSGGDLDHQTIPVSRDEIGLLATTFHRMTQALKSAHEQELQQKALEHELSIATEIQENLLPKKMLKIPGFDAGAYYRPSKEVGGDYYDFIPINEESIGVIVADVSGKGIPGSLVMTMARAFIRMEAERSANISAMDTLIRTNRMLAQDIKKGMFVTALYGILNIRTREFLVSSAGHNPMILWRAEEQKLHLVNPKGIALGFDKGPLFEKSIQEENLVLAPSDRVVLYTDGTVEAMNAESQEFGDQRFYDLCQKLAARESNEFLNLVVRALDGHKGEAPQHDDMTIVTLRVT